jgi:cytochrome c553
MAREVFARVHRLMLMLCGVALVANAAPKGRELKRRVSPWSASHTDVQRLTGDVERGRQAFAICSGCHGVTGFGRSDGIFPNLAGQLAQVTAKQLIDIRTGRRDSGLMYRFAVTLTDPQELADLSAYLASVPPSTENGKGSGLALERGKLLYEQGCLVCHGRHGEGEPTNLIPRVVGQHAKYVLRVMIETREGTRRNAEPVMQKVVQSWSPKDLEAVADYISRLRDPKLTGH